MRDTPVAIRGPSAAAPKERLRIGGGCLISEEVRCNGGLAAQTYLDPHPRQLALRNHTCAAAAARAAR